MMALGSTVSYVRHEDDHWVDEFRFVTNPRWKTSGLSGDEWRFSACIEAYRKGHLLATRTTGDLKYAAIVLPSLLSFWGGTAIGEGWEEGEDHPQDWWNEFCFQPTCREMATIEYRRLHHYCREGKRHESPWRDERLRFCDRHQRRGDCGLNDADINYEVVSRRVDGLWIDEPAGAIESEQV